MEETTKYKTTKFFFSILFSLSTFYALIT